MPVAASIVDRKGRLFRGYRLDPKGTVYSSVYSQSFRLFAGGRAFLNNPLEPYLYGSVLEIDGKTRISGSFRAHPGPMMFFVMWFSAVLVLGGLFTSVAIVELITGRPIIEGAHSPGLFALIGPGMFLFGVALVALCWRIGRAQRQRLRRFVEETFEARGVGPE